LCFARGNALGLMGPLCVLLGSFSSFYEPRANMCFKRKERNLQWKRSKRL